MSVRLNEVQFTCTPYTVQFLSSYCTFLKSTKAQRFFSLSVPNYINTLRTGDANLRFYITTVQDG